MKLQGKITLTLLAVSLLTATIVGAVAYGLLMADFRQAVKDKAFSNFEGDMTTYLRQYGTLENGHRQEPFDRFVRRRHPPIGPDAAERLRRGVAPFHFMMLDPQGRVIHEGGALAIGSMAPPDILQKSRPIVVDGEVRLRIVQVADPVLTESDLNYLRVMRKALITGLLTAGATAILLGLVLGRRLSAALRRLTVAIGRMRLDGELPEAVVVRTRDEIGELAQAFNRMNGELNRTHADLQQSHDQIQQQAEELRALSLRDPLTDLFNRRHFDQQAEQFYRQAVRHRHSMTVMVGDLDHFKQINDRYSHAVGDEVLRRVARLLTAHSRKSDIVARYGGEEFVLLLPETALVPAVAVCEKMRQAIAAHPWDEVQPGLHVTMSMGVSDTLARGSAERMIAEADDRLYQAKCGGRNQVVPDPEAMADRQGIEG